MDETNGVLWLFDRCWLYVYTLVMELHSVQQENIPSFHPFLSAMPVQSLASVCIGVDFHLLTTS